MNAVRDDVAAEVLRFERGMRRTVEFGRWRSERFRPGRFHRQLGMVCDALIDDAMAQRGTWATLNAPPRHGKTELVGRCMGVRGMALQPGFSVLYATSTATRAEEVSGRARHAAEQAAAFLPHLGRGRTWTVTEWETSGGNSWVGVGVGNPTGGIGANLVVLDDVTGSRERARSKAFQRQVREWLEEDVLTRLMPGGSFVCMETRRAEDDVCGWLQQTYGDRFDVHTWRCRAELGDTDGRAPGEWLWPERFGDAWFAQASMLQARTTGDDDDLTPSGRIWDSLYQQRPTALDGESFRRAWFARERQGARYSEPPEFYARQSAEIVVAIDGASKQGASNDWTVVQVWCRIGRRAFLLEEHRGRWDSPTQIERVKAIVTRWRGMGRPLAVLVEDASSGISLIQHLRAAHVAGVIAVSAAGSSVRTRVDGFAIASEAGDVCIPDAQWADDDVDEWVSYGPGAAHDDRTITAAMAVERICGRSGVSPLTLLSRVPGGLL